MPWSLAVRRALRIRKNFVSTSIWILHRRLTKSRHRPCRSEDRAQAKFIRTPVGHQGRKFQMLFYLRLKIKTVMSALSPLKQLTKDSYRARIANIPIWCPLRVSVESVQMTLRLRSIVCPGLELRFAPACRHNFLLWVPLTRQMISRLAWDKKIPVINFFNPLSSSWWHAHERIAEPRKIVRHLPPRTRQVFSKRAASSPHRRIRLPLLMITVRAPPASSWTV